ncbi:hypothetical protein [Massilia sp. PWRC2]|uniref:hypothetical protein n=1 Tax=Massilia sp. PWRC2 TaxID=2804626 RepID=UPI003CEAB5B0
MKLAILPLVRRAALAPSNTAAPAAPAAARLAQAAVVLKLQQRLQRSAATDIVLFKKNSAAAAGTVVIAWRVLRCSAGQDVEVLVPFTQQCAVRVAAVDGAMRAAPGGQLLQIASPVADQNGQTWSALVANLFGVRNDTAAPWLEVLLYKDGRLLCRHAVLAPGATALFEVLPYLHVATCCGLAEGDPIDAATLASATRISLLGLRSATLELHDRAGHAQFLLGQQRFS